MSAHPPLKFIHCADLRLDCPFEGVQALEPEIAAVLHRATFVAFDRVVELAIAEACDFVAVAGDVYDAGSHSLQAQLRFGEAMRRLSDHGIPCFVHRGSPEPSSAWDAAVAMPESVRHITPDGESVPVTRDGVEVARVCGLGGAMASSGRDREGAAGEPLAKPFTVALATSLEPDVMPSLESADADYWALAGGEPTVLRGEAPWVVRSGSTQGLSAAEVGRRGCWLVSVTEEGAVDSRLVGTAGVQWFDEVLDISACGSWDQVADAAFTKREEVRGLAGGVPGLLRLTLVGRSDAAGRLRRADPERDLAVLMRDGEGDRPDFVWLAALAVAALPPIDLAQRCQVEDLAGDFLRLGAGLRQAESPAKAILEALAAHPEEKAVAGLLADLGEDDLLAVLQEAEALGLELLLGEAR